MARWIQEINPDTGRVDIDFKIMSDVRAIIAAGVAAGTINPAMAAQIEAACLLALQDYDGPTHAEMTAEHAQILLNILGVATDIGVNGANLSAIPDMTQRTQQIACMYLGDNTVPFRYPITPDAAALAINRHANAGTWSGWQQLIPAATIDAPAEDYIDVSVIRFDNLAANEVLYFDLQYDGVTVASGYAYNDGNNQARAIQGSDFKMGHTARVPTEDLEIRINSSNTNGGNIDIKPVVWCTGSP